MSEEQILGWVATAAILVAVSLVVFVLDDYFRWR